MGKLECDLRDHLIACMQVKDHSPGASRSLGLSFVHDHALYGDGHTARMAAIAQAQTPDGAAAPAASAPGTSNAASKDSTSGAGATSFQDDMRERAAQAQALLKSEPGSAACDVALARYFRLPHSAVAIHRDECTRQFVAENPDAFLVQPTLPADKLLATVMPYEFGARQQPMPQQRGVPVPAAAAEGTETGRANAGQSQGVFVPPDPSRYAAHGAPVAASTMAEQRARDAQTAAAIFAVGDQKPHGVIAEGSEPGTRVYVVKSKDGGASLSTIADELGVDFDQLKELNKLKRTEGYWRKPGTKIVLPPPPEAPDENHVPVVNVDAMTAEINRIAHAGPKEGCRKNVFDAIDVGLAKAGKDIRIDRDTPKHYAEEAGPKLEAIGFRKVVSSADGLATYVPRKGDVVVLQHYDGQGYYKKTKGADGKVTKVWQDLPAGHTAMYDGEKWVSDFPQVQGSRIWGGPKFEDNRVGLEVYRP